MNVNSPTVGPILGYTQPHEARIWLRGDLQESEEGYRRCFGALRVKEKSAPEFGTPLFVALRPHFDMTGVFALQDLKPCTEYVYQAGWFFADAELTDLQALGVKFPLNWESVDAPSFEVFTTASNIPTDPRTYIVGSCRYLLRLFGGVFFDDRGDRTFASILEQLKAPGVSTHGMIMCGDQIYADDLNILAPDSSIDQFLRRYRDVFSQPYFRRVAAMLPTYMVLDDHEIEDNWPTKASERDWVMKYPAAIHAYQIYQCSHSPLFQLDDNGRITGTLLKFWYQFSDGCCDWFAMDCRNERRLGKSPRMIGPAQMSALKSWLADGSGRVKLVVSSVPMFPDLEEENSDKWGGFSAQRLELLDFILEKKIRKVVFVSGDVHASLTSELRAVTADPDFHIISVISSSFFWPYPHMDEGGFVGQGTLAKSSLAEYTVENTSPVVSTDNFGRLEIDPSGVTVTYFDRKGFPVSETLRIDF